MVFFMMLSTSFLLLNTVYFRLELLFPPVIWWSFSEAFSMSRTWEYWSREQGHFSIRLMQGSLKAFSTSPLWTETKAGALFLPPLLLRYTSTPAGCSLVAHWLLCDRDSEGSCVSLVRVSARQWTVVAWPDVVCILMLILVPQDLVSPETRESSHRSSGAMWPWPLLFLIAK